VSMHFVSVSQSYVVKAFWLRFFYLRILIHK